MSSLKNLAAAALCPLIYLLCCAILAATFAYPVFILADGDSARFFRSLVSRGGQVFLILGLYPLSKWLGLTASSLGFQRAFPRQWAMGFALGVLMLGLHALGLLALDIRAVNGNGLPDGGRLLSILAKALATGAAVALLEETIFRGVLFAAVRKFSGVAAAVAISAFYYAGLHFISTRGTPGLSAIGWDTGFRVAVTGFAHLAAMTPDSFLALFLAGVLLGCIRAALPRGLGYCMGLHAGWVFVIKTAKPLTHSVPGAPWSFLVGSYDGFVGYLAAGWMALLVLALLAGVRFASSGNRPAL
jgi:membrane protease YdiL (CAAX protease family)